MWIILFKVCAFYTLLSIPYKLVLFIRRIYSSFIILRMMHLGWSTIAIRSFHFYYYYYFLLKHFIVIIVVFHFALVISVSWTFWSLKPRMPLDVF